MFFLTSIVGIVVRNICSALNRDLWFAGVKGITCKKACVMRPKRFMIMTATCRTSKYDVGAVFFTIYISGWQGSPTERVLTTASLCQEWKSSVDTWAMSLLIGSSGQVHMRQQRVEVSIAWKTQSTVETHRIFRRILKWPEERYTSMKSQEW